MKNMNEQGRSMVEMLGVLAIIGVLSAGGLAGYSKAMFKHKLNNTIDQITMIVTNVRTLYGTQGNYDGLDNAMAKQAGVVPTAMYTSVSDSVLTNPFKGGVTIATDGATSTDTTGVTAFVIAYDGLPSEACVQIATSDFGTGAGSGFIGSEAITGSVDDAIGAVNGRFVGDDGSGDYVEGNPLALADAIAQCNGAGTSNAVALKFY